MREGRTPRFSSWEERSPRFLLWSSADFLVELPVGCLGAPWSSTKSPDNGSMSSWAGPCSQERRSKERVWPRPRVRMVIG